MIALYAAERRIWGSTLGMRLATALSAIERDFQMRAQKDKRAPEPNAVSPGNGSSSGYLPRGALGDFIYHKLFARIAAGDYAQNQRLPSENELAQTFDVSRPIIRAALDRLRSDGLIYSRQGSGSYIRAETNEAVVGFGAIETIADIQRCYEFRIALESEAAFFAAARADKTTIEEMNVAMGPLRNGAANFRYEDESDFAFHHAIAKGANNRYFVTALMALKAHISVGMKIGGTCLVGSNRQIDRVIDEHMDIIKQIADRDCEGARRAMQKHIMNARARVFEGKLLDLAL